MPGSFSAFRPAAGAPRSSKTGESKICRWPERWSWRRRQRTSRPEVGAASRRFVSQVERRRCASGARASARIRPARATEGAAARANYSTRHWSQPSEALFLASASRGRAMEDEDVARDDPPLRSDEATVPSSPTPQDVIAKMAEMEVDADAHEAAIDAELRGIAAAAAGEIDAFLAEAQKSVTPAGRGSLAARARAARASAELRRETSERNLRDEHAVAAALAHYDGAKRALADLSARMERVQGTIDELEDDATVVRGEMDGTARRTRSRSGGHGRGGDNAGDAAAPTQARARGGRVRRGDCVANGGARTPRRGGGWREARAHRRRTRRGLRRRFTHSRGEEGGGRARSRLGSRRGHLADGRGGAASVRGGASRGVRQGADAAGDGGGAGAVRGRGRSRESQGGV